MTIETHRAPEHERWLTFFAQMLADQTDAPEEDRRREASRFLYSGFSLQVAAPALALLPWSFRDLTSEWSPLDPSPLFTSSMRMPGPLDPRRELRERWNDRRLAWSHTVLRDIVPDGPDWAAILAAEAQLANVETAAPTCHELGERLTHGSSHVRGFGWLTARAAHETGHAIPLDLETIARRQPPELRPLAAWVLSTVVPAAPLAHLLEGAFEAGAPVRATEDALRLLRDLPPSPYQHLATSVERLVRAGPTHLSLPVWCRLAPDAWEEILAWTEEREPAVHSAATIERAAKRGTALPATCRTQRAFAALDALHAGASRLPDAAVSAIVKRADDDGLDAALRALGPRARAAVPAILARRPPGVLGFERIGMLIALGGPEALVGVEKLVEASPELAACLGPLGEAAVPMLRRQLATPVSVQHRRYAVLGAEGLGSPTLATELWPLLSEPDEDLVCLAIAALIGARSVSTTFERHRALDAFLRFQPSELAFTRGFSCVATALATVVLAWLEDAVASQDELLAMKLLRAVGFLREWAKQLVPGVQRAVVPLSTAHHAELERALSRIADPPPMFRPNT